MKFVLKNKIYLLFLIISFFCIIIMQGWDNLSFQNTKWIHNVEKFNQDPAIYQTAWYFFSNDIWSLPLGSNPNFGEELGSSIIFVDIVPIMALFFKSLKSFIPGNFQYFFFWFFVCFYLQLFFLFKILKKFTNSTPYSYIFCRIPIIKKYISM